MRLPTFPEIRDGVRRYANPLYHLRKFREDLLSMWFAVRSHVGAEGTVLSEDQLAEAFRGKLLACFFLSGPFSSIGWATSYWLQRKTGNPYVGQYSFPLINMVVTTLAFQVIWWLGNSAIYRRNRHPFRAFERDLLPVHGAGIRIGMTFNAFTWPLTSGLIWLIAYLNRQAAINIPAGIVMATIELVFVNTTFMRLMGDFFERWSRELARRHS